MIHPLFDIEGNANLPAGQQDSLHDAATRFWSHAPGFLLDGKFHSLESPLRRRSIRAVDLFSATGGFALGARFFCAHAGRTLDFLAAIDVDATALQLHKANHDTVHLVSETIDAVVDFRTRGHRSEAVFSYLPELVGPCEALTQQEVDLVIAGPPCQGHSNLNNHSRRSDRRNYYYLSAVAFAVAADARSVAIENVPDVVRDSAGVVEAARTLLNATGYSVDEGVLAADEMGWPQSRRRHFLVARKVGEPVPLADVAAAMSVAEPMTVLDAIGGEQHLSTDDTLHDETVATKENKARINRLFKYNYYDLPDRHRPKSHQDGHTYGASYGRMHPDRPAPTITTGFTTPGRGRFIHPTERRTITPAEAARLQGFPDTYKWRPTPDSPPPTRTQLAKWIGDAVPLPLGYAAAMSALGPDLMDNPPEAADRDTKAA